MLNPNSSNADDLLDDLRLVGISKLIGYLPISTIEGICGSDPDALCLEATRRGLTARRYSADECSIASGALFVFDPKKLTVFLSVPKNETILRRYDWPMTAEEFAHKVAVALVFGEPTDLLDLIAIAFGDKRPEYRDKLRCLGIV